jgi:enoyl-CoA hydratase/carnithine racemase
VFDIVLPAGSAALETALATIRENPVAAASLAVLLRANASLSPEQALGSESAVYSVLQSGAGFARWRASHALRPSEPDSEPAVLADRDGPTLRLSLNRPSRHNAFSLAMRDALAAALAVALVDDSIRTVELRGNGPSFCSGGDLAEFGSFADPATAHIARLARSPARLLHRLARRTRVHLHGACIGAGIELAAFADSVRATADTTIALPEITLGLIPGAGGTVSITRRAGRHRCMELALCGPIDAETALRWHLVDEIVA